MTVYGKLLLALPSGDERELVLEKESVTLGRETDNDIVIPGATVSRHHARITFGAVPVIEDLGSTFGVLVGDKKVSRCELHSGDVITLSSARLRFAQPEVAEAGLRTVVDLSLSGAQSLEKEAHEAVLNHTLIDVSLDVAQQASRQDATFQVVISEQAAHLIVREGGVSRDVALDATPIVIGRDATCQVALASKRVSRRHAEIRHQAAEYVLVDLGSANGTEVNGHALTGTRNLADGDMIAIGEALIIFRSPAQKPAPSPRRASPQSRRPVVIVPGLAGSELRRNGTLLWPNYPYLLAHPRALMPESGPVEVTGMISEVVVVPHLIKLDTYSKLTRYLETNLGYHLGVDLMEFPYDWRQDGRVAAGQLSSAIRTWRESMGHDPVTIIAHSFGGLVTRYYLDQLDGHDHVSHFIVMGTPHLGTARSASMLLEASGSGPLNYVRESSRALSMTWAPMYQVLPRFPCVFTTRGEELDLFKDQSWLPAEFRHFLTEAQVFLDALQPHTSVPTLCVIGYSRPTISRIVVEHNGAHWKMLHFEMEPIGDGGVMEQSAMLDGAEVHPVRQDHGSLFSDPDVHRRLSYELLERR